MRMIALGVVLAALNGCASDRAAIDTSQSLVMESSVLSAGILTDEPTMSVHEGQQRASSRLYNQQEKPVTLHYRFYWYDEKGLEILPFEAPRRVTVAPHSSVDISSQTGNLTANKVRLYLYL
ncbi:YcfL family protein [Erwinia sp. CGal63]|uniref:YcfL family protein n=1 Tax=Erwinia sp. CGal63 TaxID=2919889 RepID=UPI0030091A7B